MFHWTPIVRQSLWPNLSEDQVINYTYFRGSKMQIVPNQNSTICCSLKAGGCSVVAFHKKNGLQV